MSCFEAQVDSAGHDAHLPKFLAGLIQEWDLVPETLWESSPKTIHRWIESDEAHIDFLHGEINAFASAALAQFKISGWINPKLRAWAERALLVLAQSVLPWEVANRGMTADFYTTRLTDTRKVLAAAPKPSAPLNTP